LKSILEAIHDRGLSNIHETVREVRLTLRGQLPGNDTARQQIEIPEQWEGLPTQQEGTVVFTASPFVALQLLSQVRKWMESRDRNAVLIIRSAALRPFLRRLVECEFPYVAVLSQDEILRSDALPSA
jgi:flagellar biosynthesis component FlhA